MKKFVKNTVAVVALTLPTMALCDSSYSVSSVSYSSVSSVSYTSPTSVSYTSPTSGTSK